MNLEEKKYLELLSEIMTEGNIKSDRTGIGTKSIFGSKLSFSLKDGKIPMLTTKKMFARGVIEELLFFIRGESNSKLLEEKGVNIWKGNTTREFLDKRGLSHLEEGSLGKGYGYQWRNFSGKTDQIANLLHTLKTNPDDRRMLVAAWNPGELNEATLPPCHTHFQCYVNDGKLSLQFYMRSSDLFLGVPFNLMSYALLTHILANATGLQADKLIFVGGDTHIYSNHFDAAKTQIEREPFDFPTVKINKSLSSLSDIEALEFKDFVIEGYQSHASIKAEMAI